MNDNMACFFFFFESQLPGGGGVVCNYVFSPGIKFKTDVSHMFRDNVISQKWQYYKNET